MSDEIVNQSKEYNLTTVGKFIQAFNNGYNITEACHYAGVSRESYYNWLKWYPDFSNKMEEAKLMPMRKAKEVVLGAILEGDTATARWLLDRRDPDFKPKGELDNNLGVQQRTEEKIEEFLDDSTDGAYDEASGEPVATAESESGEEVASTPTDIS